MSNIVQPGTDAQAPADRTSPLPADWEVVSGDVLEGLTQDVEHFVRIAHDNVYERLLCTVQDYLTDNLAYNIRSKLDAADRQAKADRERAAAAEHTVAVMRDALIKAEAHLHLQAEAICGNESYSNSDTAEFFKGYNSVIRRTRTHAAALLPAIRSALTNAAGRP